MPKKVGFKFASISVSTPDGKDLAAKLQKLIWAFSDELRPNDRNDTLDLAMFMLYCSYISRNAENLCLDDFDLNYSIDEAKNALGNKYVASGFVEYYAGLCDQKPSLPDLGGIELCAYDLSKDITGWASALDASGLSLMEGPNGETAATIQRVLAETLSSDAWDRYGGEFSTPLPVAELTTRIADVEGKSVLDFACGNGIYLAAALSKGALSATGRDISVQAVTRAKILCFFADPTASHDISAASALTAASSSLPAQRVFVAPPLGMRLREFDIQDKGYYADILSSVMGEGVTGAPNMEDFCVAKAFASLADDGIAILHVSASFLFHQQKARRTLRRALVERGNLQTVIELPGGVIPGTRVKSALLAIAKQPTDQGVLIIDLDSKEIADKGYVSKGRGRCEITDKGIDWLTKVVQNRDVIPLVSTVAERDAILTSGSNLCYSTYGDVFDYDSILAETRSTKDIMDDIKAAQASIDSIGKRIADILSAIEKKG